MPVRQSFLHSLTPSVRQSIRRQAQPVQVESPYDIFYADVGGYGAYGLWHIDILAGQKMVLQVSIIRIFFKVYISLNPF